MTKEHLLSWWWKDDILNEKIDKWLNTNSWDWKSVTDIKWNIFIELSDIFVNKNDKIDYKKIKKDILIKAKEIIKNGIRNNMKIIEIDGINYILTLDDNFFNKNLRIKSWKGFSITINPSENKIKWLIWWIFPPQNVLIYHANKILNAYKK